MKNGRIAFGVTLLAALSALLSGCFFLNRSPVASFTRSPSAGQVPLSVFFDASASYDPDGTIVSHEWRFGDGATGSGVTTTHTYRAAGSYAAELAVSDDRGARNKTTKMIVVSAPGEEIPVGTKVGQAAPDFTLKNLEGEDVSLSQFRGLVVLLDFWESACPPCRETMPYLETLRERYAPDGLVLVAVSLDQSAEELEDFLAAGGYSEVISLWESQAAAEEVKERYGVAGVPHTFVIDRQGIIRYSDHPIRLRDRNIEPWL